MRAISLALALVLVSAGTASASEGRVQSVTSTTPVFTMDQVYKSMFGPIDYDRLLLPNEALVPAGDGPPEVVWITGLRAKLVTPDGDPESPEYFCHSNLRLAFAQPVNRMRIFGRKRPNKLKMFTLVQGQTEIRFPAGFGMPVLSNDQFGSQVMVMNPTQREAPVQVGVESQLEFIRQSDLQSEMKPLYVVALILKTPVETPETQLLADQHEHGKDGSCLDDDDVSEPAVPIDVSPTGRKSPTVFKGTDDTPLTTFWYVPPGRHVYRHRLEGISKQIPGPTRAHYISAHLHPYGESIELIDHTSGKSVFKSIASNYPDRVALQDISHYSSVEGVPIDPTHDYELVAIYNNTSAESVDSMAVMYLYLYDADLKIRHARPAGLSNRRSDFD